MRFCLIGLKMIRTIRCWPLKSSSFVQMMMNCSMCEVYYKHFFCRDYFQPIFFLLFKWDKSSRMSCQAKFLSSHLSHSFVHNNLLKDEFCVAASFDKTNIQAMKISKFYFLSENSIHEFKKFIFSHSHCKLRFEATESIRPSIQPSVRGEFKHTYR